MLMVEVESADMFISLPFSWIVFSTKDAEELLRSVRIIEERDERSNLFGALKSHISSVVGTDFGQFLSERLCYKKHLLKMA